MLLLRLVIASSVLALIAFNCRHCAVRVSAFALQLFLYFVDEFEA
jgi:hypothetical protein